MVEKVFTQEQLAMLADCILAQISAWAKVGEGVYRSESLNAVKSAEIGKLRTLLDYINVENADSKEIVTKKVKIIYTIEDYATVNGLTDADAIEAAKEVSFNRSLNGMTATDVECFVVESYENDNI